MLPAFPVADHKSGSQCIRDKFIVAVAHVQDLLYVAQIERAFIVVFLSERIPVLFNGFLNVAHGIGSPFVPSSSVFLDSDEKKDPLYRLSAPGCLDRINCCRSSGLIFHLFPIMAAFSSPSWMSFRALFVEIRRYSAVSFSVNMVLFMLFPFLPGSDRVHLVYFLRMSGRVCLDDFIH
jgi:hypothetical protein